MKIMLETVFGQLIWEALGLILAPLGTVLEAPGRYQIELYA